MSTMLTKKTALMVYEDLIQIDSSFNEIRDMMELIESHVKTSEDEVLKEMVDKVLEKLEHI